MFFYFLSLGRFSFRLPLSFSIGDESVRRRRPFELGHFPLFALNTYIYLYIVQWALLSPSPLSFQHINLMLNSINYQVSLSLPVREVRRIQRPHGGVGVPSIHVATFRMIIVT